MEYDGAGYGRGYDDLSFGDDDSNSSGSGYGYPSWERGSPPSSDDDEDPRVALRASTRKAIRRGYLCLKGEEWDSFST